jgi:hypothetical protein
MYKYLKARKELISIDYQEEILEIKQLNDGKLAVISGSLTNNKLVFYSNKIKDIGIKNKNTYFTIEELHSPITSINQCTDQTLLILTLDSTISLIKLNDNDNNKYSIIQKLNAVISNSNAINEKENEKIIYYKKLNSRITTMLDYNSCKVMQLSNSLILSIYDNIIKFYQVNIIHNLYEQVKKIELADTFTEPLQIDSSTITLLSWSSQCLHFYNIDTQLLLKRLEQINGYLSVKISDEFFGVIGPKYFYLIAIKEQEIKNMFNIPRGYEVREAVCTPLGTLICSCQDKNSYDIVEFDFGIYYEKMEEIGKIENPHKNEDYDDGIKIGSSSINTIIITHENEIITGGDDRKIKVWN